MLKKLYIISSLTYIYIFSTCCFAENMIGEPYPQIEIPTYLGAKDVDYFVDLTLQLKSKSYVVESAYPATEVINFYNRKFKELGLNEFLEDPVAEAKWINFQDGTKKGHPFIRQFAKSWIDQEKRIEILLVLRYETTISKKWNDKLLVVCQIAPFVEHKVIFDFFKKLEKEGKSEYFFKLLEKYYTTDQNVDFERAIRENPNNQYLKEYRDLIKRVKSQQSTKSLKN